jgi:hypothetical protein
VNDHSAIEVNIPAPWRLIGRVFVIFTIICCPLYIWLALSPLDPPSPQDDDVKLMAILHIAATPIMICYFLPVFIDCYPAWFVRLVGREHLLKMIRNIRRQVGEKRKEKADFYKPNSWLGDKRIFVIVWLLGLAVLGFFHANGWLFG